MELVNDRTSIVEEEDRISNLPDEVIQHILCFLDMKYAVQTSMLSRKWERIWASTLHLNLNSGTFRTLPLFAKFVKHALSHRSNHVEVSKVQLTFTGAATPFVVKSIVNYAYLHNVRELNITWFTRKFHQFPECLFSSRTLKHLILATSDQSFYVHNISCIPKVSWNFPALESVCLSGMHLGDNGDESLDLFSKCVNLRDLTLHKCCMNGLKIFNIYAPELSDLTVTDTASYPDVFNVVAPQLKNLTASIMATRIQVTSKFDCMHLSTEGFDFLEKVNLSLSMPDFEQYLYVPQLANWYRMKYDKPLANWYRMRYVPQLLNLFPKLHSTKFLVINLDIIETLSLCLDQLSHEPSPFDDLKCLKINTASLKQKDHITTLPTQVRNYLLENSPGATFIMDLPQVPQKRSRQQVHDETITRKLAKMKEEKKQPATNRRHPSSTIHIQ